jgi:hypothetical protein
MSKTRFFTYHVSRITYHVSRITYHVSRITHYSLLADIFTKKSLIGITQH